MVTSKPETQSGDLQPLKRGCSHEWLPPDLSDNLQQQVKWSSSDESLSNSWEERKEFEENCKNQMEGMKVKDEEEAEEFNEFRQKYTTTGERQELNQKQKKEMSMYNLLKNLWSHSERNENQKYCRWVTA